MIKNGITWNNYVSLVVGNTLVNVGQNNSVIVEARQTNKNIILMSFPSHMTNNNTSKATKVFVKVANNSSVEELFVSTYVHLDYSLK